MGTVLFRLERGASSSVTLAPHREHDRPVALLAVAGCGKVTKAALAQIDAAVGDWRRGDRGLAAIRLAFMQLPRLHDAADAHRLTLAEQALDLGLSPYDLLSELGYVEKLGPLLKTFDPSQPRVPAGQGAAGGQNNPRKWLNGFDVYSTICVQLPRRMSIGTKSSMKTTYQNSRTMKIGSIVSLRQKSALAT